MNALIFLADGFETVEALQTYDILKRSHHFNVLLCSISSSKEVVSSHGVVVHAEATFDEVDLDAYSVFILPGGGKGVENLSRCQKLLDFLPKAIAEGKDVHAICAAPSILGGLGLLDGLPYTCFPGFQKGNGTWLDEGVVETTRIITGRSMGWTMEFAKTIVAHYYGEECVEQLLQGVMGLKEK